MWVCVCVCANMSYTSLCSSSCRMSCFEPGHMWRTGIFKAVTWSKHLLQTPSSIHVLKRPMPGWVTDTKSELGSPRLLPQACLGYLSTLKSMGFLFGRSQKNAHVLVVLSQHNGALCILGDLVLSQHIWDLRCKECCRSTAGICQDKTWIHTSCDGSTVPLFAFTEHVSMDWCCRST